MAGGARPGAGRPKGVPNKVTADVKALAQQYAPDAMRRLNDIAMNSESDAASVAAIKELLDRGYGKAKQPLVGGGEGDAPIRNELTVKFV